MNVRVLRRLLPLAVCAVSLSWGRQPIFEQLSDGSLWQYGPTEMPCNGNVCSGWIEVDSGNNTLSAAAGGGALYQMRNDFSIWQFVGPACTPPSQGLVCSGWQQLDNNPTTAGIFVGGDVVLQAHIDGSVWMSTGQPCQAGSCPGWKPLGNDSQALVYWASAGELNELRQGGQFLTYQGGGFCCNGWVELDNNPNTVYGVSGIGEYQLHNSGSIWQWDGIACSGNYCPGWQMLDNNPNTVGIVADTLNPVVYQIHRDHSIWRSTGTPCSGNFCPGWVMIDDNPSTTTISAGQGIVYQGHSNGEIWQYTATPCSGNFCPGWELIGNKPGGRLLVNQASYVR